MDSTGNTRVTLGNQTIILGSGSAVIGAVTQSGVPWNTLDSADVINNGGPSVYYATQVAGIHRNTLPNISDTGANALLMTANGQLMSQDFNLNLAYRAPDAAGPRLATHDDADGTDNATFGGGPLTQPGGGSAARGWASATYGAALAIANTLSYGVISSKATPLSGSWTDASFAASSTASTPSGALAAVTSRIGLHVWNLGSTLVCMNYTSAAAISGTACAAGSVPIAAGSAYLEDQPGNVSPEAISFIAVSGSDPLTIKVR